MDTREQNTGAPLHPDDIARLELYGVHQEPVGIIENRPGQKLSLSIYHRVAAEFNGIGPAAARRALELYGEHAADAQAHPGKHPNIDRLFRIIEEDLHLTVKAIPRD